MRLECPVQHYAWGSTTAIPELLGVAADGRPWAELWIGAHPAAPSILPDGTPLDEAIAGDPAGWLGTAVVQRFGPRLPYLLKVLAAGEPLSLQAHPSEAEARAGFDRENAAGLALDAPTRVYKDPHHKPELLCALTPFDALCGFRPISDTSDLLAALPTARGLQPFGELLRRAHDPADALREVVGTLLTMPAGDQRHLAEETAAACAAHDGPFSLETSWMVRLADRYPGDIGSVVSLFLNVVRLEPGQAIGLTSGNLHAYLSGTGVELMANSDNVLRGGLTPKHVDVPELLRILDCAPLADPVLAAEVVMHGVRYAIAADEFRLDRVTLAAGDSAIDLHGPAIVLTTEGDAQLDESPMQPGRPEIVRADTTALLFGQGTAFVAAVNL
jgi:mannose-6-phosphate isomerase